MAKYTPKSILSKTWKSLERRPYAGLLHDPAGEVLVWRREGEEFEVKEADDEAREDEGFTVHDLDAIGRLAEERLGCSVEAAAVRVRWPCRVSHLVSHIRASKTCRCNGPLAPYV